MSADVGVGHTSAAKALRAACQRIEERFDSTIADSYRFSASVFSRVVSNGYIGMVKTIPQMYSFLYDRAEKATEVGPFRTWMHQFTAGNIRSFLVGYAPDVVVCTHAFPCGVMSEYKKQFADAPPVFGVVTDFAVHAFWMHRNVEGYAVATEQMRENMIARGIEARRVLVTGIPIDPAFGAPRESKEMLRRRLGLPVDRPIVLLMGGGLGIAPLQTIVGSLESLGEPVCAVAIVGRGKRAEARALESAQRAGFPMRVLRFVENVHDYMHACDLLVTKPGGLTSSEALAANLPLVLFGALPGQEARNTRYLVQNGAALRAKKPEDLTHCIRSLLVSGEKRERMRDAMRALAKPDAAARIAEAMKNLTREGRKGEAIA